MESWRVVAPSVEVDFQPRFWMVLVICWAHPLSLTRPKFPTSGPPKQTEDSYGSIFDPRLTCLIFAIQSLGTEGGALGCQWHRDSVGNF